MRWHSAIHHVDIVGLKSFVCEVIGQAKTLGKHKWGDYADHDMVVTHLFHAKEQLEQINIWLAMMQWT